MTVNENLTSNKARNFQSIGFIGLIKLCVLSMVVGILLGEFLFWILTPSSIFFLQRFNDGLSDSGAMILGIFLGFYLKPIMSGMSTFIGFSILLRRSKKEITNKNLVTIFGISLMYAIPTIVVMGFSIIMSAIEAEIPLTNLSEIYRLFIR